MPTSISSAVRVLHRYLHAVSPRIKTAAVVLTDSPRGWDWGWVVGSEPPMHVIPMMAGRTHIGRIDLEDELGRPCFQPRGRIPTEVLNTLRSEVERHGIEIETAWCHHMVGAAWIEPVVDPVSGLVNVTLYGGTTNERTRSIKVNWPKIIGSRKPTAADVKIDGEAVELVIGAREANPITVPLSLVVFAGQVAIGDGIVVSDAAGDPWQRARARRVAERYVASTSKTGSVVLTDSPPGWDWGWFADDTSRMHIVPMSRHHRHEGIVYLEDEDGRRVFEPEGQIPADVLIELAQEVELHDVEIEDAWCREAAMRGWVKPGIDALGGRLMVMVYAGQENERIHGYDVNWRKTIGPRKPLQDDVDIDIERSELVLGPGEKTPVRIPLRHLVFQSRGAVVDGVVITEPDFGREQNARLHGIVGRFVSNFMPPGA